MSCVGGSGSPAAPSDGVPEGHMAGRVRGSGRGAAREGHLARGRIKGLSSARTTHAARPPDARRNCLSFGLRNDAERFPRRRGPRSRTSPKPRRRRRRRRDDDLAREKNIKSSRWSERLSAPRADDPIAARRPPPHMPLMRAGWAANKIINKVKI